MTDIKEAHGLEVFTVPGRYLAVNRKNPGAQDVVLLSGATAVIDQLTVERDAARESMLGLDEITEQQSELIAQLRAELAALKSSTVVMPERRHIDSFFRSYKHDLGWNACLDKFESLNRSKT